MSSVFIVFVYPIECFWSVRYILWDCVYMYVCTVISILLSGLTYLYNRNAGKKILPRV